MMQGRNMNMIAKASKAGCLKMRVSISHALKSETEGHGQMCQELMQTTHHGTKPTAQASKQCDPR
jgi:hypothetical protein